MKGTIRSLQTRVPGLWERKHDVYNALTARFGLMMTAEFELLRRLDRVGQVLDIGGNHGQSITAIQRCCDPDLIVSFEPIGVLARRLTRKFAQPDKVRIERCALSNAVGEMTLHVPQYRHAVLDALATDDPEAIALWLENPRHFASFEPRHLTIREERVPVRTLNSYDFAPDVVKIDVQGLEQAVVEGGIAMFDACKPLTIVEAPPRSLVDIFRAIGMAAYGYAGGRLREDWEGRPDVLFLSDAMRARLRL